MVKDRRTWMGLAAGLAALALARPAAGASVPVGLADAGQRGVFNVGPSRATVTAEGETGRGLRIWYELPKATAAGVWNKGFPSGLDAGDVDVVVVSARPEGGGGADVAASLELKGADGVQSIPLDLAGPPAGSEHAVDWGKIGKLTEVVVSITPKGDRAAAVSGTITLDGRFEAVSASRKLAASPWARLAAALGLAALAFAGMAAISGRRLVVGGFAGDLIQGLALALVAAAGMATFDLGSLSGWDSGWWFLGVALAGLVASECWSVGLVGRHLTAAEAFRDTLATGVLAAASSPMAILQAPGAWADLVRLSQTSAGAAVVIYHLLNARSLATTGRHLGAVSGALVALTPFAFGDLAVLSRPGLVGEIGGRSGLEGEFAEVAGRAAVLFLFNEAVALGLGLATKGSALRSIRGHLALLVVALYAAATPVVADLGSGATVAGWPAWARSLGMILAAMVAEGGLWAEVYLVTGLLLDAIGGAAPSGASTVQNPWTGLTKGAVYSGVFLAILLGAGALASSEAVRRLASSAPWVAGPLFGALAFPLVKTIFETFDGSQGFFRRAARAYRNPRLYLRGAVVGLAVGLGWHLGLEAKEIPTRAAFGLLAGALAFAGVDLAFDGFEAAGRRARVRPARAYLVQGLLGGSIGAALGFYFDAGQVAVVLEKFARYLSCGVEPIPHDVYPFLSKWGRVDLGTEAGGVKLLFNESVAGVISWAVPAWLFAINATFMRAYFQREAAPIRSLVTPEGRATLATNMIQVLRWGLWMSPIINSFLRKMAEPTWYNQDGAVRTLIAIGHDATEPYAAFRTWSLRVFTLMLTYDALRILIWLDHFGLRVATLVNLSFLGMDRLDERLARFLRPSSTARCIPEGVKRFATWAPLVIPFYLPQGDDWKKAWADSGAGKPSDVLLSAPWLALPWPARVAWAGGIVLAGAAAFSGSRSLRRREPGGPRSWKLANPEYEVELRSTGELVSRDLTRGFDLSRRSYDGLDPAGRALFVVEGAQLPGDHGVAGDASAPPARSWAILGQFPGMGSCLGVSDDGALAIGQTRGDVRVSVAITLPGPKDPAELWTIRVENRGKSPTRLDLVPYLEWVLNRPDADRGHTQYNRLFAEMEYAPGLHAVLAWDKHAKAMGFLASDAGPSGFLTSRMDFIGRARSLRKPRILETMAFSEAGEVEAHPTFDPIASLRVGVDLEPGESKAVRLLIGLAGDKAGAIALIARHLAIPGASGVPPDRRRKEAHSIGHGEIPPGTPQPYAEFIDDGRTLRVLTPFTPRPWDHVLSNALGHVVDVTNRGIQTTSSGNSQQNRVTPDWSDTVTREVPGEAFYLHDPETGEWWSPTYHPLNDAEATYETDFGLDGTATFRMSKGALSTELTVFVPPGEPAGVYRLTVRNGGDRPRVLRFAPCFQVVLAAQPEAAGPLKVRLDRKSGTLLFENPRNHFREGPAFAAVSPRPSRVETSRARFFGVGRDVARPAFVESGQPDRGEPDDDRPVAAFLVDLEVPPRGEATAVVVLGQADDLATVARVVRRYRTPGEADVSLAETRRWWSGLLGTLGVATGRAGFDGYLGWLRYQALAERIWARRGFYQASGAFGFRDQLQDSVNLLWMDPAIARRQILLHASQQFLEGDVVHWFHRLGDGRTGFAARTHASDNLLWLAWGVVEYVEATGDLSLLDERTTYLESELPFEPLPAGKHGMGFDPLRSSREDTVYRHCLRAIDLVLDRKMGAHGLPLIGTGDWNDGLDEIGSKGRGESVWLGFFLYYILERMAGIVGQKEGEARQDHYLGALRDLGEALESTWRDDRYLRAFHDDGTEIGVKDSGVWEIDALTAAWAVMANINPKRGRAVFETALGILEKESTILLGWPPLREDTKPYLGRSSWYPEGVRENGMYCHGVQWLVGAARRLSDQASREGRADDARHLAEAAYRLWLKISPLDHSGPDRVETYGGQPNKQAADMVTTFDPGRMIWNGYTGAAGWMFRQALEGVLGLRLIDGAVVHPAGRATAEDLGEVRVTRDLKGSPLKT